MNNLITTILTKKELRSAKPLMELAVDSAINTPPWLG